MPPAQTSLSSFFKADPTKSAPNTRKRALSTTSNTNDKENLSSAAEEPSALKRAKAAPKKAAAKKDVLKKATSKSAGTKRAQSAAKVYKDAMVAVAKNAKALEKSNANTDKTATAMAKYIPKISALLDMESAEATNLKASGYGNSEKGFTAIDDVLLKAIEQRVAEELEADANVARQQTPDAWTGDIAFGLDKFLGSKSAREPETLWEWEILFGKRPNKSERNKVDRLRREGVVKRAERRKERREQETPSAWIANAIKDTTAVRKHLADYGLGKHYLRKSMEKLSSLLKTAE